MDVDCHEDLYYYNYLNEDKVFGIGEWFVIDVRLQLVFPPADQTYFDTGSISDALSQRMFESLFLS